MGQYHLVVNFDKRQYLHPHRLGDGLKLMEFGNSVGGVTTGLVILLAVSNGRGGGDLHFESEVIGSWGGDSIAIVGDYAEDKDLPLSLDPEPSSIYSRCLDAGEPYPDHVTPGLPTYRDISADVRACIEADGIFYFPEPGKGGWIERREHGAEESQYGSSRPDMIVTLPGSDA